MKNKVLVFIALVPMIIVILFGCWDRDEDEYSWSSDYSTCTKYKNKKEVAVVQTEKIIREATCTEKGEISYKANFGGKDIQTAGPFEVDPLGHNFGDWVDGKRQCDRCGEIETCNHDGSRKNIEIEATRTTDGYKGQVCEICGKVLIQETIKAKGDIPGNAKFTNGIFRKINSETVNNNATNGSVDEEYLIWADDYSICTKIKLSDKETVNTTSEITKEATCIESGKRTYTAKFSDGTTKTKDVTIPVKNHDYVEWKDTKDGLCARECQNCSAIETKSHEYGDWINGVRTCKNCGAKESCIHDGTTEEISKSYPTCTEDGVKKLECSRCRKTWTEKILATDHSYGEWKDTKNGSCARKCQNCSAVETKIHEYGDWINGVRTCKNCGAKESCIHEGTTKEISMSYPTCTEDGVKKLECSRCKKTWTEKISAMGHNYGEWKDTKNGSCARKCQNCSAVETKIHDYGEWKDTKNGSCERKCQNCFAIETKIHDYGDWINGVRICKNCGTKEECDHSGDDNIKLRWESDGDKCVYLGICTNCNEEIFREEDSHDWELIFSTDTVEQKRCKHCGKEIVVSKSSSNQ